MPRPLRARLLALAAGGSLALCGGELVYRSVRSEGPADAMYFRDAQRRAIRVGTSTPAEVMAFRLGIQVPWPDPALPPDIPTVPAPGAASEWFGAGYAMPRRSLEKNATWRPGARFHICYDGPRQDYFDADGCVEYRFNRFGIRDREDLTLHKPAATTRIVCLGDSLALGWGVRQEANWPVLVEERLRARWPHVQVVNCGGAGSSYADEYELALRHRFGRFEPDLVLVSLCLNDLIVTNGKLCHYRTASLRGADLPEDARQWWMASRLLFDLSRALAAGSALEFEPGRDLVRELMELPADHLWYRHKGETPDVYWVAGTPQAALRGIRDWCADNGARTGVLLWPLLQGLDEGAHYPFARLHGLVGEFCAAEGLPFLDLLPVLAGQPAERLWVSPADMHPNERAQQLVAPAVAAFAAGVMDLR